MMERMKRGESKIQLMNDIKLYDERSDLKRSLASHLLYFR